MDEHDSRPDPATWYAIDTPFGCHGVSGLGDLMGLSSGQAVLSRKLSLWGSKTPPRLRVARHGSFLELVVFKWRLTAVHHDGVQLE